jgi:hypothetical protein
MMLCRLQALAAFSLTYALLLVSATFCQATEARVALVIGNSAYTHAAPLANPQHDAEAMATTLRTAGFEIIGGAAMVNLDKAGMERAIREFGRRLGHETVGLFFYAGHGIQVNGSNYLVPVNADLTSQADVKYELVDAGFLNDEMVAAGNRLNLIILDACRNNPFGPRGLRGIGRGLAQVTAPAGTLIGYSTQPGEVASDGDGINSPYTAALIRAISRPGSGVFDTFNDVGLAVKTATNSRQQPWLSSSPIEGQFYFTPSTSSLVVASAAPPPNLTSATAVRSTDPREAIAVPRIDPSPAPAAPSAAPPAADIITLDVCPSNHYSVPMDRPLTCGCTSSAMQEGSVLGDNPYGRQSSICHAARHAGAIKAQGGQVTVIPVESVPFFPGVRRNGIYSSGSDSPDLGFRVIVPGTAQRPDPVAADGSINLEICPGNHYSIPMDAPALTCLCPGSEMKDGSVVGDNPYERASSPCHAALHAGALTSRGGQVTVVPDQNVSFYPSVTRNGISSNGNDQGAPGFRVLMPGGPQKTAQINDDGSIELEICPNNYYSVPMDAPSLTCGCPVSAMRDGSIVGDNPYGRQSGICRAAMHAGALTSRGGKVTVTPVVEAPFYPAIQRNGVGSSSTDAGPGFRILLAGRPTPAVAAVDRDASGRPNQQPVAPRR